MTALGARADGMLLVGQARAVGSQITLVSPDGRSRADLAPPKTQNGYVTPQRLFEAPDQTLYACGAVYDCCGYAMRYAPDGTLDSSFGVAGSVSTKPYINSAFDCALGADGHLAFAVYQGIEDLDANGALVFDDANHTNTPTADDFHAVVVADDGTIYAAGWDSSHTQSLVRAVSPDGTPDRTFGGSGEVPTHGSKPLSLMLRRDGLVVLTEAALARVAFDGTLTELATTASPAAAMTQDACGRIVTASYEKVDGSVLPMARVVLRRYWP